MHLLLSVRCPFWPLQSCGNLVILSGNSCLDDTDAVHGGLHPPSVARGSPGRVTKKAGVIHINRLCAILLFEGNFNFGNKVLFGCRMTDSALQHSLIPSECFGSIPGWTAIHVSLACSWLADLSRLRQWPLAIASVDAQSCYDRITHLAAALACQCLGIPSSVTTTMFMTIQLMKFFLRTTYGDSADFYGGGLLGSPFQGVCQGRPRYLASSEHVHCSNVTRAWVSYHDH